MNSICTFFNSISELSQGEIDYTNNVSTPMKFTKNTDIFYPGNRSKKFYYLTSGAAKMYQIVDGREIVYRFAFEEDFIGAVDSIFGNQPSIFGLRTVEKVECYELNYNDIEKLYENSHNFEKIGRLLAVECYMFEFRRTKELQTQDATYRYRKILEAQDNLLQRVPLKDIASYLGITQVQLSRIRRTKI